MSIFLEKLPGLQNSVKVFESKLQLADTDYGRQTQNIYSAIHKSDRLHEQKLVTMFVNIRAANEYLTPVTNKFNAIYAILINALNRVFILSRLHLIL
jgi:hypothetical protein